jgi:hypothetical protein
MRKVMITIAVIVAILVGGLIIAIAIESQSPERQVSSHTSTVPKIIPLPDPNEIEVRVNAYRTENGAAVLTDSEILSQAAQARAEQMCADNDWSHDKAWEILDPRYSYTYASENLFFDYLKEDFARLAIEGWASSDGHRENMLKDHREIGVGVKSCPGFQGYDTAVIVTNYFGVPR